MEEFNGVKVNGRYRTIVKRADGRIEESEWKNTIDNDLLYELASYLYEAQAAQISLDNPFPAAHHMTAGDEGYDGIILNASSGGDDWYCMQCSRVMGYYYVKVTGVITGFAITIYNAHLGFNVNDPYVGGFAVMFAGPTSWSNITLAVADELTIEWTISFS